MCNGRTEHRTRVRETWVEHIGKFEGTVVIFGHTKFTAVERVLLKYSCSP